MFYEKRINKMAKRRRSARFNLLWQVALALLSLATQILQPAAVADGSSSNKNKHTHTHTFLYAYNIYIYYIVAGVCVLYKIYTCIYLCNKIAAKQTQPKNCSAWTAKTNCQTKPNTSNTHTDRERKGERDKEQQQLLNGMTNKLVIQFAGHEWNSERFSVVAQHKVAQVISKILNGLRNCRIYRWGWFIAVVGAALMNPTLFIFMQILMWKESKD